MRKYAAIILALAITLCMSLTACGSKANSPDSSVESVTGIGNRKL